ncbi:MAG: DUF2911 domain-containing protein [Saprospiraceae bacterium]|nr:DUF2911 domain-containing protein [Saprospiraceae bacterium]HRG68196.1 DUF2911 domain-containing protein [Saprospiraceae bacterium]
MKKLLILFLISSFANVYAQVTTPAPSPTCKTEQKIGLATVTVEYSRPSKKNRIIFGDLVPYGKIWRTGANACTKITFSDDVELEGVKVPKGSYALFTIPGENTWEVILYNDITVSGVPDPFEVSKEVAHVKVTPELIPYTYESFTIGFDALRNESAILQIIWETSLVPIKLRFDTDMKVMKSIEKVMAGPSSNDYYQAARYYFENNKDLNLSLKWIQLANQMDPQFWKLRVESLILAKLGRKSEAIEVAQKSKAKAIEAKNDEYVKMNDDSIKEWSN